MLELTQEIHNRYTLDLCCEKQVYKKVYFPLFKGKLDLPKKFSSYEEIEKWFLQIEKKIAKNYLLYLLGRQDYLSTVLIKKFEEKSFSKEVAENLISEYVALGYINDDDLIKRMIKAQMNKEKGPIAIYAKLKAKGVEKKIIEKHLQKCIPNDYQKEKIKSHITKMKKKGFNPQKIMQTLYRFGFEFDQIKAGM